MSLKIGLLASSQQQAAPKLLDDYPGASIAYSLRKLRSAYTGSAIRVVRNDNAVLDIGFNALGGLDTTALLTFIGSGNGFINIWYDQSGNGNNAIQILSGARPQIVISGVLVTQNGLPSAFFNNYSVEFTSLISSAGNTSSFIVAKANSLATAGGIIGHSEPSGAGMMMGQYFGYYKINTLFSGVQSVFHSANNSADTNFVIINQYINTLITMYKNNTFVANTLIATFGTPSNDFWNIGRYGGNFWTVGNISEVILYKTNQFSNRTGINGNINTYYTIF